MQQTLNILERLIGFDTVSAKSNLGLIAYIEDFLEARGFEIHRISDDSGEKAGLFATLGPRGPGGVLLSGHTDVVPVEGQVWTREPFKLTQEGERFFGRGTTDMKGYLASMLSLADRAAHMPLKDPLKLAFSYDEEIGVVGIKQMIGALETSIGLPRVCFVGEPTGMQVAIGHKGKAALRAICQGQNGHSALAPRFVNALHLAVDFVQELRALQKDLIETGARDAGYDIPYTTFHVGKMQGGIALNIVPDQAVVEFEYRHLAVDPAAEILQRIEQAATGIASRYQSDFPGARIDVDQYNAYPGLAVEADSDVVSLAQQLAQSNRVTKVPYGTEAGYFAGLGIATVVCGPGSMEGQGHKPDEYLELSELVACDAMMDRILAQLVG